MPRKFRRSGPQSDLARYAQRPIPFVGRYIRCHAAAHTAVFLSVVVAVACSVLSQYAVKNLVDVLSAEATNRVWGAFILLTALIAADNMSWRVGGWIAARCFVAVTGDMRRDLFQYLTGHAPAYFAERLPGMLAGRITAVANAIFQVENTFAWNVLPPTLAVIFSIVLLARVNAPMAGVLVVLSSVLAAVLAWLSGRGRPLHRLFAVRAAELEGDMVDVINNMMLVRAFGATLRERERFAEGVGQEMDARRRSLRFLEKLRLFHAGTTALLTAGLLGWSLNLWSHQTISTGDVVLVTTLGFTILHGTRDLAVALVDTIQQLARLSEALSTLLLPHEMTDAPTAAPLAAPKGAVEFEHVTYGYTHSRPVLKDFCLRIAPGERVGLVGRSGSGKSTALTLLQRLRRVEEGRVLIDGQNINDLTEASLRAAIAVVPQDVTMFNRSVRENIRYGRPEATDEEVHAAAEAACCTAFIEHLDQGYDTAVGDRGVRLSGGQRQRLAIARAFLRNAPILLLDEATSALDSESEEAVQRALDRLIQGRTVIAVAHRLSTLRDFDRIVVVDRGQVVQEGSPRELERLEGPFRHLLLKQQTGQPREAAE